jgi:hypothetical protein
VVYEDLMVAQIEKASIAESTTTHRVSLSSSGNRKDTHDLFVAVILAVIAVIKFASTVSRP